MTSKKLRDIIIKISAVLLFATLVFFVFANMYLYKSCFNAAKRIPPIPAFVQMRFTIYGSSDDTVSGIFRLYDNTGEEIAAIERSWSGETLYIDYVSVEFSGKKIQFPLRIYTKNSKFTAFSESKNGTQLPRYYLTNDLCLLYDIAGHAKDFKQLSQYALRPDFFGQTDWISGLAHSSGQTLNLGGCEPGKTYTVVTDFSGSLALLTE